MKELIYGGQSLTLARIENDFAELCLKRDDAPINKLDNRTLQELEAVVGLLEKNESGLRGLLISSAVDVFVVGADITEFGTLFTRSEAEIAEHTWAANQLFERLTAIPVPSVVAINGFALGGGLELALSADYRVMSEQARIGLPEVSLGLIPGYGGTVRLPRVSSVPVALDWIVSGKPQKVAAAVEAGVVDAGAAHEQLRESALAMLQKAAAGELDWQTRRQQRLQAPVVKASAEVLSQAHSSLQKMALRHQPARAWLIEMLAEAQDMDHRAALRLEGLVFARVAKTQAAASLVRTFLNGQILKKAGKQYSEAAEIRQVAVLGAGIMGGGIAYTTALNGTPVRMKDIRQEALDLGMAEANKLLKRQVASGRMSEEQAARTLGLITPQLDFSGFAETDVLIEAVVENIGIKHAVLREAEQQLPEAAVLLSNTSSLRIDDLAKPLARPQQFAGMHFFNPVPVMPLVEIIKGQLSSDQSVATAVSQAVVMGKTPIVVKDCPGFLVNRILAAYIRAFLQLVADGADFEEVDRVVEAFGWPMGPAYLEDVIGLDTGAHVCDVIFEGYPQRMTAVPGNAIKALLADGRLGQKSGAGFYRYEQGPGGRPRKISDERARAIVAESQIAAPRDFTDEEIIERLMLPLIIESVHALQEGVVSTAAELDTALLLGIGFPAYLGGALVYADWLGSEHLLARCEHYSALGEAYQAPEMLRRLAAENRRFYDM